MSPVIGGNRDRSPRASSSVVVIVGLPGVGKSTVGRRAARSMGWDFVDLDAAIESSSGRTIREIFDARGEEGFRALESRVLRENLAAVTPRIVATGGGVILREENRDALRSASVVIWMKADLPDLEERLRPRNGTSRGHRPLLDGDLTSNLQRMASERGSLYADVATDVLETSNLTFEEASHALIGIIGERRRRSDLDRGVVSAASRNDTEDFQPEDR